MLILKGIICIVTFILLFFGTTDSFNLSEVLKRALKWIGIILGIIFCLLLEKNWLIIPKIVLFIAICSFIWLGNTIYDDFDPILRHIIIGVEAVFITLLVCADMYDKNVEEYEEISSTKSCTLIYANDTSSITGNIHGTRRYVYGSISEKPEYKYYYMLEDGSIKLGSIPADDTTIYYIKSGEEPYLETIVTTRYEVDNNKKPATCQEIGKTTTYRLYIPEGSITNEYKFDAE